MERTVSLEGAGGIVVDAFTGAREQARGCVVLIHDQVGIGLVALERNPDAHLAECGSGERVRAAQSLGAEEGVHSKGAALADNPVEEKGGLLRNRVVFDKELLELVDEQERTRDGFLRACLAVAGQVLDTEGAEDFAASAELVVDAFQDAECELPVTLHGNDPGMGKSVFRVALEFDALLEVDEVELDLCGAEMERKIGDEDVEQCGFSGTRFTGQKCVLSGAVSERKELLFGGASPANWDAQFEGGGARPDGILGRGDLAERDLNPGRIDVGASDLVDDFAGELGAWRWQKLDPAAFGQR